MMVSHHRVVLHMVSSKINKCGIESNRICFAFLCVVHKVSPPSPAGGSSFPTNSNLVQTLHTRNLELNLFLWGDLFHPFYIHNRLKL